MKEVLLIEGNMASNYMFVTMYCLSYYSMLSPFKVSNDTTATSLLLPTFNLDSIFYDIMAHNYSSFHWWFMTTSNTPKHFQGLPNSPWCPLGWHFSITPRNEKYYFVFINQLPTIHKNNHRYSFNGPWCSLVRRLFTTPTKIIIVSAFIDILPTINQNFPGVNPMDLGSPYSDACL